MRHSAGRNERWVTAHAHTSLPAGLAYELGRALGTDTFDVLRAEGAAMAQQDAIAFALPGAVAASG